MRKFTLLSYLFLYLSFTLAADNSLTSLNKLTAFEDITCGQIITATTEGQNNKYNYAGQCADFFALGGSGEAGDLVYKFVLTEAQTVSISLRSAETPLEMYLVNDDGGIPGTCITQTDIGEGDIFRNLSSGTYWIVIDGLLGYGADEFGNFIPFPSEGEFELTLNCFPVPSICDLESVLLAKGNTVIGKTSDGNDFTSGHTPTAYLDFIPCVIEQFPNQLPNRYKLYEYYHDGTTSFFSINIDSDDPNISAFVFDCDNQIATEETCLNSLNNGFMFINTYKPGFYKILVLDNHDTSDFFTISLSPASSCLPNNQFPMIPGNYSVNGQGNHYNKDDYNGCYNGTQNYDGEEIVFVQEFNWFLPDPGCFGTDKYTLTATSQMSLLIFNDLCGGSCIGSIETGPDGGTVSLSVSNNPYDPSIIPIDKNGIYYVVVDQAKAGTPGNFTLTLQTDGVCSPCPATVEAESHLLSFSDDISLSFLGTEGQLFMDFSRTDPFLNYRPIPLYRAANGALGEQLLPFDTERCGYNLNEMFVFTAIINESCYQLEPTFNPGPFAPDENIFKIGGKSQIIDLKIGAPCGFSVLNVTPGEFLLNDPKRKVVETTISTDGHWTIQDKVGDWYEISDLSGTGKTKISITTTDNNSLNIRYGSFKVVATNPNSNNTEGEVFKISQPASISSNGLADITCGQTIKATTEGQEDNFNYAGCAGIPALGGSGEAGDLAYKFVLPEAQTVSINLNTINKDQPLELYLVDDNGNTPDNCITKTDFAESNIFRNLSSGTYWIIVDGQSGYGYDELGNFVSFPNEGEFELSLNCFPVPSICDLGSRLLIEDNILYGSVYRGEFTSGETPVGYLDFFPCIKEQFPNEIPSNYKLYEYYHDESNPSFSVNIETENPTLKAFIFDCNNRNCLASNENGTMTITNAVEGFYNILILENDDNVQPFLIDINTATTCVKGTQFPLHLDITNDNNESTSKNYSVTGQGNNYDLNDYQSCYEGDQTYDGEEIILVKEFTGHSNDLSVVLRDDKFTFSANSQMGVFIFNDLCGGSCIGSIETGPNGGTVNFEVSVDPGFEVLENVFHIDKNSVYYIVIDQAKAGPLGDFTLAYNDYPIGNDVICQDAEGHHTFNFTNIPRTIFGPNATIYADFIRKDPELNYTNTPIFLDQTTWELPFAPDPDKEFLFKKCGYLEGEEIVFIAEIDGVCTRLEAIYNPGVFAPDKNIFRTGGKSEIIGLKPIGPCNLPVLEVTPGELLLNNSENSTVETTISTNSNWRIEGNKEDWYSFSKLDGIGKTKIDISISPNNSSQIRIDTFKIVAFQSGKEEVDFERFIITQPANDCFVNPIITNVIKTDISCPGEDDGTINLNAQGGNGALSFDWNINLGNIENPSNLAAGDYAVTITDQNACTNIVENITLNPSNAIETAFLNQQDLSCVDANDGSVSATATGGTGNLTYTWSDDLGNNPNLSNLVAASYFLTVTDANGCAKVDSVFINQPQAIEIVFSNQEDISCADANDGSVSATATGGTGNLTYTWSDDLGNNLNLSNLAAASYFLTVTDANGCAKVDSVFINQPQAIEIVFSNQEDISCADANDGSVSATATGGTGNLTYTWSDDLGNNLNLSNLAAASYFLTVTDANGCAKVDSAFINQPQAIEIVFSNQEDISCADANDGSVSATATGGTGDLTYTWSDDLGNNPNLSNLAAATYFLTVTDANGCSKVDSVAINQPSEISANFSVRYQKINDNTDGAVSVQPSGGTPGYTYVWNTEETTDLITHLLPDWYSITITDANGCTKIDSALVADIDCGALTLSVTSTNANCFDANNGSATVVVENGNGNYSYKWSNDSTNATISSLSPDTYTVSVVDDLGCLFTASVIVSATSPPIATLVTSNQTSCNDLADGTAEIALSGGIGTINVLWRDGDTRTNRTDLAAGDYTVFFVDESGCQDSLLIPITELIPIALTLKSTRISAIDSKDAKAWVEASGGTGNYTYQWSNGEITDSIRNLSPNTYLVTVTDENGCLKIDSVQITDCVNSNFLLTKQDVSCSDATNGIASIFIDNEERISYLWENDSTTNTLENLPVGTYTFTITTVTGCIEMDSVIIEVNDTIVPIAKSRDLVIYLDEMGMASITAETIDFESIDNCGIAQMDIDKKDFNCEDLGTNKVALIVTDNSGNQAVDTAIISVLDTIPPPLNGCSKRSESIPIGSKIVRRQTIVPTWAKKLHLYPNPVKNTLYINSGKPLKEALSVQLIDVYGKTVIDKILPKGTNLNALHLSQLTKGIYWAKIGDEKGVVVKKVIVH